MLARKVIAMHMSVIFKNLSSGKEKLVVATLELLASLCRVSASITCLLYKQFDWSLKALMKFPSTRRKDSDKGDVRTAFVKFLFSVFEVASDEIKEEMCSQKALSSVLRSLFEDKEELVLFVLQIIEKNICSLKLHARLKFFNENMLMNIAKIFESHSSSAASEKSFELMLNVCSVPGKGVCFNDFDYWTIGKQKNKILSKFISMISFNSSVKMNNLILKILQACPSLITTFWKNVASFDPSLKSDWISLCGYTVQILNSSLPSNLDLVSSEKIFGIMPHFFTKTVQLKGIRHESSLVRYLSLLVLHAIMKKTNEMKNIQIKNGQENEICGLVYNSVVDVQIILGILQRDIPSANQKCLIHSMALKILALYYECFYSVSIDPGFDIAKILDQSNDILTYEALKLFSVWDDFKLNQRKDLSFISKLISKCDSLEFAALLTCALTNLLEKTNLFEFSDPREIQYWVDSVMKKKDFFISKWILEIVKRPTKYIDQILEENSGYRGEYKLPYSPLFYVAKKSMPELELNLKEIIVEEKEYAMNNHLIDEVTMNVNYENLDFEEMFIKFLNKEADPLNLKSALPEEPSEEEVSLLLNNFDQFVLVSSSIGDLDDCRYVIGYLLLHFNHKLNDKQLFQLIQVFDCTNNQGDLLLSQVFEKQERMFSKSLDCILWYFGERVRVITDISVRGQLQGVNIVHGQKCPPVK